MLSSLGLQQDIIDRVCYLVGHHHTYTNIDGIDYQILVEADFLVNLYEDNCSNESVKTAYERIFRTEIGKLLCKTLFCRAALSCNFPERYKQSGIRIFQLSQETE